MKVVTIPTTHRPIYFQARYGMSTIRILAVLLVLSVAVFSASGQTAKPTRVYVSSMPTGTQWTELQQHAYTAVKTHLDSLGVVTTSKQEEYVLFVDASEERDQVAVSLLFGHALPDEVVELGKKAEVMYSGLPADKQATLPASKTSARCRRTLRKVFEASHAVTVWPFYLAGLA
jgi:hypothetical protein